VSNGGHVLRTAAGAQAVEVFMEDHVEHPVQAVLDTPFTMPLIV
jgi:hypothetical protein